MSPTPDFVEVQLTDAGRKMAGDGGSIRVANAHFDYEFRAGAPVRVTRRYEWERVLSQRTTPDGQTMFEIAPPAPPAKSLAPSPTTPKNPVPPQVADEAKGA